MLRLTTLLIAALSLCFFGCASTQQDGGPSPLDSNVEDATAPLSFAVHDIRSSQRLTIVSDAWLRSKNIPGEDFTHRRANFYAQKKSGDDLKVKVVNDSFAKGIWQAFEETGYARLAKAGKAPVDGNVIQVLEVVTANGPVYMAARRDMDKKDAAILRTSVRAFADLYNNIIQLQASQARPTFRGATGKQ